MKKSFPQILLTVFLAFYSITAQSQTDPNPFAPPPPPNEGNVDDVPSTQAVPFDGGLTVLLSAGAGYGLVRIRRMRK